MIKKLTPKIEAKITLTQDRFLKKEVIITSENGRDRIEDVFIGGYPRVSLLDTLRDLYIRLFMNTSKH